MHQLILVGSSASVVAVVTVLVCLAGSFQVAPLGGRVLVLGGSCQVTLAVCVA